MTQKIDLRTTKYNPDDDPTKIPGRSRDMNDDNEFNVLDLIQRRNAGNVANLSGNRTANFRNDPYQDMTVANANIDVQGIMNQDYDTEGIEDFSVPYETNIGDPEYKGYRNYTNSLNLPGGVNYKPEDVQTALSEDVVTDTTTDLEPVRGNSNPIVNNNGQLSMDNVLQGNGNMPTPLVGPEGDRIDPYGGMNIEDRVKLEGEVLKNHKVRAEIDKINNVSNYYRGMGLKPIIDKNGNVYTTDQGVRKYLYISPIDQIIEHSGGTLMFQKGVNTEEPVQYGISDDSFEVGKGPTNIAKSSGDGQVGKNQMPYTLTAGSKYPDNFYGTDGNGNPLAGTTVESDVQVRGIWETENGVFTGKMLTVYHGSESSKNYIPTIKSQVSSIQNSIDKSLVGYGIEGLVTDYLGDIDWTAAQPAYAQFLRNALLFPNINQLKNNPAYSRQGATIDTESALYSMDVFEHDKNAIVWKPVKDQEGIYHMFKGSNSQMLGDSPHQGDIYITNMLGEIMEIRSYENGEIIARYADPETTEGVGTTINGVPIKDLNEYRKLGK